MGMVIVKEEGAVLRVNLGRPIVTDGTGRQRALPKLYNQA